MKTITHEELTNITGGAGGAILGGIGQVLGGLSGVGGLLGGIAQLKLAKAQAKAIESGGNPQAGGQQQQG